MPAGTVLFLADTETSILEVLLHWDLDGRFYASTKILKCLFLLTLPGAMATSKLRGLKFFSSKVELSE